MKKKVIAWVMQHSTVLPKYSGKSNTMYIPVHLCESIVEEFGYGLPFKIGIL